MLKAIVYGVIGAGVMYLYLGHGDIPAFIDMSRPTLLKINGIHQKIRNTIQL